MHKKSKIEWTETTWNPTTGCTKISSGCKNCYAERMSERLRLMGVTKYKDGFQIKTHEEELVKPYGWKSPQLVFVNSMSDLFHEKIPIMFIENVFRVMNDLPQHTFQVLTKRADRLFHLAPRLKMTANIWIGVSVENDKVLERVEFLKFTDAKVKFLSCEPLVGPLKNLNLDGIDWVIVGGESGPKARSMDYDWVMDIKENCHTSKVPFFFKQWGGTNKKKTGRLLNGKTYDEMPIMAKGVLSE